MLAAMARSSTHTAPSPSKLRAALKTHFGYTRFRPFQQEIVSAILMRRDVFAALPTGGGKSLCYQLPALLTEGLTLVISPLISLMKDQVDAARQNGIGAVYLNSALSEDEYRQTWSEIRGGEARILYLSPEKLASPGFREQLSGLPISFIAIDEAHCISEWGHEFRPDYRTLGDIKRVFPEVPVAAFTATATLDVQQDVVGQLDLSDPLVIRASFDRKEISYAALPKRKVEQQILEFAQAHEGMPGIVYRSSRKAVEATASYLEAHGISAHAYHAGMDAEQRSRRQEAFVRDEVDVIVATIAFGMGIDKSNVRWVIHGDLPRSIEAYYQETGRAARDGDPAETVLFYGPGDAAKIRWHIGRMENELEQDRAEERLREVLRFAESGVCRRKLILAHFNEEHPGNCGNCDICLGVVEREDTTRQAQMLLSAAYRTGERFGGHHLADIVCGNATDRVMDLGHNELPTFGVGREYGKNWWLGLVRDLESAGHLQRADGRKSGFTISASGWRILREIERFQTASFPTAKVEAERSSAGYRNRRTRREDSGRAEDTEQGWLGGAIHSSPSEAAGPSQLHPRRAAAEEKLYQQLKDLRTRLARQQRVPPYVIFSDKSLRSIARNRPTDEAGFLRCPGVGEAKLQKYGAAFIGSVQSFLEG